MRNRTDFCIDLFAFTIRSPAWETAPISVRVITTSVSLTAETPFHLQGTRVIPIPFWSHLQSSTSVAKTVRFHGTNTDYRSWETSLAFFLYLPPSIGLLLTVRSIFFFAAERRRTRAIFERHHARAASVFTGWRSSLPFFFLCCLVVHGLYRTTTIQKTPLKTVLYYNYPPRVETVQYIHRYHCLFFPACLAKHPFCARSALPTRYAL